MCDRDLGGMVDLKKGELTRGSNYVKHIEGFVEPSSGDIVCLRGTGFSCPEPSKVISNTSSLT